MTFTEAAVEVLRLVGRPLHYKKITEIAIAKNLLSHVGKAPDMTMSSRLATMIKKDRGDEPIIKVKPGVFGLREFTQEVLALADADFDIDVNSLPDIAVAANDDNAEEPASESSERRPRPTLPGADIFPEEEDDDEPILGNVEEAREEGAERPAQNGNGNGDDGRRGRRRRRRGRKGGEAGGATPDERARRPEPPRHETHPERRRELERLDMNRAPEEGDVVGQDLAEAIYSVLERERPEPWTHSRIAEHLIRKGRLTGSPAALAPTLAAAIRADGIRRGAQGARFRLVDGRVALTEWYLPSEATRMERDARRAAALQREAVHRAFLRKLNELPTAAFAELLATWLNAEGISALRAVRRPGSSGVELHLAGMLRRGQEEVRVAIVVLRDGRDLRAERIVEVRGALHHYAQASAAWVITTARADSQARMEVEVPGAPPVVLFDGRALAAAMEARGVGLRPVSLPLATIDLDLLDALRGEPEDLLQRDRDRDREQDREDDEEGGSRRKRRRKRRRDRELELEEGRAEVDGADEDEFEDEDALDEVEAGETETVEEAAESIAVRTSEASGGEVPRKRRRRRRGRKRRGHEAGEELAVQGGALPEAFGDERPAVEDEEADEDLERGELADDDEDASDAYEREDGADEIEAADDADEDRDDGDEERDDDGDEDFDRDDDLDGDDDEEVVAEHDDEDDDDDEAASEHDEDDDEDGDFDRDDFDRDDDLDHDEPEDTSQDDEDSTRELGDEDEEDESTPRADRGDSDPEPGERAS